MKRYGLRRESDGLLIAPAMMAEPDEAWKTARQNKAAVDFGGVWQVLELDADTYGQVKNKLGAGRAAYLVAGEVVSQGMLLVSADKTAVLADDTDAATISINVDNPAFTALARYRISTPEGIDVTGIETLTAGTGNLLLTTEQIGRHIIRVDVLEYGSAEIIIEGVE